MGGGGLENSGRHQLQCRTARGDRNKKSGSGQWPTGRRETPHGTAARRERPPERLGVAYARGVKAVASDAAARGRHGRRGRRTPPAGPRIGEVPPRPPARAATAAPPPCPATPRGLGGSPSLRHRIARRRSRIRSPPEREHPGIQKMMPRSVIRTPRSFPSLSLQLRTDAEGHTCLSSTN